MWTPPDITLDPGAFLLIYASGKDRKPDGGIDHWEVWSPHPPPGNIVFRMH